MTIAGSRNCICLDLESVLTLQTKLFRCSHIFLGKCLPPINTQKRPLLKTVYGLSPDRTIRDKQVTSNFINAVTVQICAFVSVAREDGKGE